MSSQPLLALNTGRCQLGREWWNSNLGSFPKTHSSPNPQRGGRPGPCPAPGEEHGAETVSSHSSTPRLTSTVLVHPLRRFALKCWLGDGPWVFPPGFCLGPSPRPQEHQPQGHTAPRHRPACLTGRRQGGGQEPGCPRRPRALPMCGSHLGRAARRPWAQPPGSHSQPAEAPQ